MVYQRPMQILFIAYVFSLFRLNRILPAVSRRTSLSTFDWFIVLIALNSAAASFHIPNLMLRAAAKPSVAAKNTPAKRWMTIHILRMAFSLSAGLDGVVLHTTERRIARPFRYSC